MKWCLVLILSTSLYADYSPQDTENLIQELQSFHEELDVPVRNSRSKKRKILTLSEILNKDSKPKEVATNAEVTDLDQVFKNIRGGEVSQKKNNLRKK